MDADFSAPVFAPDMNIGDASSRFNEFFELLKPAYFVRLTRKYDIKIELTGRAAFLRRFHPHIGFTPLSLLFIMPVAVIVVVIVLVIMIVIMVMIASWTMHMMIGVIVMIMHLMTALFLAVMRSVIVMLVIVIFMIASRSVLVPAIVMLVIASMVVFVVMIMFAFRAMHVLARRPAIFMFVRSATSRTALRYYLDQGLLFFFFIRIVSSHAFS
jgi:hypothetical protein